MKGGIEAVVSVSIKSLTSSLAKVIMRGNISSHDSPPPLGARWSSS